MKPLLFCLLFCSCAFFSTAQPVTDTVMATKLGYDTKWTRIMETDPNDRWNRHKPNQQFQFFDRFPSPVKQKLSASVSFYGNACLNWLNGQPTLELAAVGINKENADSFLYHVVVNDSIEIIPWQHPSVFKTNSVGTYAYLGKFESLNKLIKLELYHINQYYDKKIVYYNNFYTPAPVIAKSLLLYNDPHLFNPNKQHYISSKKIVPIYGYEAEPPFYNKKEIQHHSFEWSDSINHIKISINPTLLNEMYHVYLRNYSDAHADTIFISNKWNISYYSKNPEMIINAAYFKKPGNYELIITPEVPEAFNRKDMRTKASLFFSVKPSTTVQFSSKQAIMYTAFLTFIGGSGFFYYRGKNKRQLAKKQQEKELATHQLRAIRSQLNPHFMFNALSGIQNLVNKNQTDKANNYLSRFARITRRILSEAEQDITSIEDEKKLLEDYLLMEQLRFGFQYSITVAQEIDQAHINIPAMLIQPLVENAVKHGIAGLSSNGRIDLSIELRNEAVIIQVKDNGKGFSLANETVGHGLKLVKERIQLLNKLYPDTNIRFDVLSTSGFCICQLELNNWI